MSSHIVPLYVNTPFGITIATDAEVLAYQLENPVLYKRWATSNRIKFANQQIEGGTTRNVAWARAFEKYPQEAEKPKYVYTPKSA